MADQPSAHSDLPPELERALRDQSIVVPQDGGVFGLVFTASDPPHSDTPPCACRRCREGGSR
jgi:hypothetical protein